MIVYEKNENYNLCCNLKSGDCVATHYKASEACTSFQCPFYKPKDMAKWVRIDRADDVAMYSPEEAYYTNYGDFYAY